ncbi:hypothetical protein JHK86_023469 [Glycine max]|nr:hypothetical protein JHK86_023469 [Glycine max]
MFEMLQHCPKLQTFVLNKLLSLHSSRPKIWACPQYVPKCIATRLKRCTIKNYEGKE